MGLENYLDIQLLMAIFSEKPSKKSFLCTYTKSVHRKAAGSYHVTIISLDSVHRCHHLIHKYSCQINKKQNPYVFHLNHFFGLGTTTLHGQNNTLYIDNV